jgi:hypothetical protein
VQPQPPVEARPAPKAPAKRAAIALLKGARYSDAYRRVALATLTCPAGGGTCSVTAPKRVTMRIAGK